MNYLDYLKYWKQPKYVKYIKYPHCLAMIDLLQRKNFRDILKHPGAVQTIEEQQILHWIHYNKNRIESQQP
eukprot:m.40813 g.40813  ORF g.40813 m.40813 type:complete len:71 (+) comp14857_c0_seq1:132-344(+)